MIIIFMITASTTLASIFTTFSAILVSVDREHRIRSDRIQDTSRNKAGRLIGAGAGAVKKGVQGVGGGVKWVVGSVRSRMSVRMYSDDSNSERERLLG
jgi:hypothetical protein